MDFGAKSKKGNSRDNNEDAFYLNPEHNIFIVADGVGGASSGEVASNGAIEKAIEYIQDKPVPRNGDIKQIKSLISDSIKHANDFIVMKAKEKDAYKGMGTTFVMFYIEKSKGYIANLGDSRAYVIRQNDIRQITNDHTVPAELIRKGEITEAEAENHPGSHMITKAIGMSSVEEEIHEIELIENDIVILCTDGLYNVVEERELVDVFLSRNDLQGSCEELMERVKNREGQDDHTVLAVRVRGEI